ncbi:MAG: abortive infection family protein, partial [Magnetococcales bacterium]|nr:abortive infection family protein [Magnetococcales bacterium]
KTVLKEHNPDWADPGKTDINPLMRDTLKAVNVPNAQIRSGITSIAQGVAEARNKDSLAGHGKVGDKPLIGKTEIQVFVTVCDSLVQIILAHLDKTPPDIRHTTMAFKELEELLGLEEFNRQTDTNVSVEYDQEEGTLFIDGKEIRPSEILYHFDRENYAVKIQNAQQDEAAQREKEALFELLHEQAMTAIDHHLCEEGVFDNFDPGHYGYEPPEIWIDEIKINKDAVSATATGTVETTARLGSSREEDGIDINYSSGFTALFVLLVSEETGISGLELKELNLDTVDWSDDCDYPESPEDDLEPNDP